MKRWLKREILMESDVPIVFYKGLVYTINEHMPITEVFECQEDAAVG